MEQARGEGQEVEPAAMQATVAMVDDASALPSQQELPEYDGRRARTGVGGVQYTYIQELNKNFPSLTSSWPTIASKSQ